MLEKFAPIFHPIRSKTKTNRDSLARVSRALRQLPVITSSFDWFTVLCVFFFEIELKTLFIHGILSLQSGILKSRALYNILIRSTNYALI